MTRHNFPSSFKLSNFSQNFPTAAKLSNFSETFQLQKKLSNFAWFFPTSTGSFQLRWVLSKCSKINQRSLNDLSLTFISLNRPGDGKHIRRDETRLFVVYIGDFKTFLVANQHFYEFIIQYTLYVLAIILISNFWS